MPLINGSHGRYNYLTLTQPGPIGGKVMVRRYGAERARESCLRAAKDVS